jgi:two-component system OmpR family sensor kinase
VELLSFPDTALPEYGDALVAAIERVMERPEPVEVAELTADLYAKCRALGDRDWRLASIGECTAPLDPQRITQAVVQLAQNAVQHTTTGDEIQVGSSCHDGRVTLWITDHGPGVPEPDHETIFGRFARGSTGGAAGPRGVRRARVAQPPPDISKH